MAHIMTSQEKIHYLINRYEMDKRGISGMLSISSNRMKSLLTGASKASREETLKLDRAIKVRKMIAKHCAIQKEINLQENMIDSFNDAILDKLKRIDASSIEEIKKLLSDIRIESMYEGMMYANLNEDEVVLKQVRNRRK